MPKSLGSKLETQPAGSGLVPGGYVEYIVWEKLPGTRLDFIGYWTLDDWERKAIVHAFQRAYK